MKNRLSEIEQAIQEGNERQQALARSLRGAESQAAEVEKGLEILKNDAVQCEADLRALTQET